MNRVILIAFLALTIPQITFAAWWNPISWFSKKQVNISTTTEAQKTTKDVEIQRLQEQIDSLTKKINNQSKEVKNVVEPQKQTPAQVTVKKVTISDFKISDVNSTLGPQKVVFSWRTDVLSEGKVELTDSGGYKTEIMTPLAYLHNAVSDELLPDRGFSYKITAATQGGTDTLTGRLSAKELPPAILMSELLGWPTSETRLLMTLKYDDGRPAINYPLDITVYHDERFFTKKDVYTDKDGLYLLPLQPVGGEGLGLIDIKVKIKDKVYDRRVKLNKYIESSVKETSVPSVKSSPSVYYPSGGGSLRVTAQP